MPSYNEDAEIDTSSIAYPKTGIRLLKFVTTVFGQDVLEKIKNGEFYLFFNETLVKYDDNFRNYRVKEDTKIIIRVEGKDNEVPEDFFA